MSPPSKKFLKKGAYGYGDDPESYGFLKIDRDPFEAAASGHGYNAKFSDDDGYERGQGIYSDELDDGLKLVNRLPDEARAPVVNEKHDYLLDNERDQPAGKWLGGGGEVGKNAGGKGPPRFAPKTGPIGNMRKPG